MFFPSMQVLALASQIVERSNDGLATSLAAERIKAREAVEKFVVFVFSFLVSTCLRHALYILVLLTGVGLQ